MEKMTPRRQMTLPPKMFAGILTGERKEGAQKDRGSSPP